MASPEQIRRGIERYVNEEFLANMSGWKQFAAATALGAALPHIQKDIDIEPIYQSAMQQINQRPDGVTLTKEDMQQMHPVLGSLAGTIASSVTFKTADVEKLYQYITEG